MTDLMRSADSRRSPLDVIEGLFGGMGSSAILAAEHQRLIPGWKSPPHQEGRSCAGIPGNRCRL